MSKKFILIIFLALVSKLVFADKIKDLQIEETRVFTLREMLWKEKLSKEDIVFIQRAFNAKDIASLSFALANLSAHEISLEKVSLVERRVIETFLGSIETSMVSNVLEFRRVDKYNVKGLIDGVILIKKIRQGDASVGDVPSKGIFSMLGKYAYMHPSDAVDDIISSTAEVSKFGLAEALYMESVMTYPGLYEEKVLDLLKNGKRSDYGFVWLLAVGEAKAITSKTFRRILIDRLNKDMIGRSEMVLKQVEMIKGRLKFQDELEAEVKKLLLKGSRKGSVLNGVKLSNSRVNPIQTSAWPTAD